MDKPVDKPKRKLTPKQRALVKARVLQPDATLDQLGRQVAYSQPRQSAFRELQKPHVQEAVKTTQQKLQEIMDQREKLSLGALLDKIEEGLSASQVISVRLEGEDPEAKVFAEVPDFKTQHKFLETALDIREAKGKKVAEGAGQTGPINIAVILGGGGSEAEKAAVADVLVAARLTRGLHPIENRKLTAQEAEAYRGGKSA